MSSSIANAPFQPQLGGIGRPVDPRPHDAVKGQPSMGTLLRGAPPAHSPLSGASVGVRQAPPSASSASLKNEIRDTMEKRGPAGAIGQAFKQLGHAIADGFRRRSEAKIDGIVVSDLFKAGVAEARAARKEMNVALGAGPSILDRDVKVLDANGQERVTDVKTLMTENLKDPHGLANRITVDEMETRVKVGEKMIDAIKASPTGTVPLAIQLGAKTYFVYPTLDNVRNISWALQAKGISDNAAAPNATDRSALRPPAMLTMASGSMIAKDPDNKIYNFFKASENCYGRASTHCAERSDSKEKMGWSQAYAKAGFFSAMLIRLNGQALQLGIEDFDKKLPGAGGTMLFDKLKPSGGGDGAAELFLKWEPVGTPHSFGFKGKHGDDADGFTAQRHNLSKALARNVEHIVNERRGNKEDKDTGPYRGEKLNKGKFDKKITDGKIVFNDFEKALAACDFLSKDDREGITKSTSKFGVYRMRHELDQLMARARPGSEAETALNAASQGLDRYAQASGASLGIDRAGNEIHLVP